MYAAGQRVGDIQRLTGYKRDYVEQLLADFRVYASQDRVIRERAREVVLVVDQHYADIVKGLHTAADESEANGDYKVTAGILKSLADVEAKRVELLQKAGLLADNAVGDQIAESDRKQRIIVEILQQHLCASCRKEVASKLSQVTEQVEPTRVIKVEP